MNVNVFACKVSTLIANSNFVNFAGGSEGLVDGGEGQDGQDFLTNEDNNGGDEISGTSKLEVENAWLKAELASAVAMLCNLDPDYEVDVGAGDSQDPQNGKEAERVGKTQLAAQKTEEALRLKDEHAKHLHDMLAVRQVFDFSITIFTVILLLSFDLRGWPALWPTSFVLTIASRFRLCPGD